MKLKKNPRARVGNWRDLYEKVNKLREKHSIEYACVAVGIAISTYYQWKRRADQPEQEGE
jgi:hypothetical protein